MTGSRTGAVAGLVNLCWTSRLLLGLCNSSLISSVIEQVVMSDQRKLRLLSSHLHVIEILTYKGRWFRFSDPRPAG